MSTDTATPPRATALLGALRNVADNVKLFRLLLEQQPREERGTWDDALGKLLDELREAP